jgi:SAM-dependent methyltransferase
VSTDDSSDTPERTDPSAPRIFQAGQPDGVPPLELTGERTLPDVPQENYWYQRHLVVYEWIARRLGGKSVIDMACGEGYGADLLARRGAAKVVGVDANPEAFEHARLKYTRPGLSFARELVQSYPGQADAVVFLQTIEHVDNPGELLNHFKYITSQSEKPQLYVSTPNVLTLAPEGAERSGNPWHVYEYRPEEFAELLKGHFSKVEMYGLFHAGKLRVHELAIKHAGWDTIHARLGITRLFYDRFTPAINTGDFTLRPAGADIDRSLDLIAVCEP